jgi:pimeloyl-ACP methyl ester carboxylesterase
MTPTLRNLCPAGCRGISADPVADLATLVTRLRAAPATGTAYDRRGRAHRVRIRPLTLLDFMFDGDYDPALRAALPAAVQAALAGDYAPLARLLRDGDVLAPLGPPSEFSSARFATVCEETPLPWAPGTPVDQRPAVALAAAVARGPDAFRPFDAATTAVDGGGLCMRWPDVPRPVPPVIGGPYPAVPTLILQGGEDLRTPPEDSAHVASLIPGAIRVVVPGVGHAVTGDDPSGCGESALLDFLARRSVVASCRRVPTHVPAVPAPPTSFSALATVSGVPARVGRTLRAIAATLDDLRLVLSPISLRDSGGGLRGGWWGVVGRGSRLVLHRYETVPGVTLSGSNRGSGLQLRVGGRSAAHGTLLLRSGGRVSGRLGGRRVRVQLGSAAAAAAGVVLHPPHLPRVRLPRLSVPRPFS